MKKIAALIPAFCRAALLAPPSGRASRDLGARRAGGRGMRLNASARFSRFRISPL